MQNRLPYVTIYSLQYRGIGYAMPSDLTGFTKGRSVFLDMPFVDGITVVGQRSLFSSFAREQTVAVWSEECWKPAESLK
jgi:hypothetical protein